MAFPCFCLLFVTQLLPCHGLLRLLYEYVVFRRAHVSCICMAMPNSSPKKSKTPLFLVWCTAPKSMGQMETLPGLDEKENPTGLGKQQRDGLRNGVPWSSSKMCSKASPRWSSSHWVWLCESQSVPQINQWNGLSFAVSVKLFQTALKCHRFHSCWH